MIEENELEDIGFVLTHEDQAKYTHFQNVCHARLDRIYVPAEFVPLCSQYHTQHVSFSDHCLVMITLSAKKKVSKFNWELWKFNNKVLKDEIFVAKIKEYINSMQLNKTCNFIRCGNSSRSTSRSPLWKEQVY